LPPASLQKLRGGPGDCRDLKIYIGRIGFDQFDPERATRLGAIETRFRLPVETGRRVDRRRRRGAGAAPDVSGVPQGPVKGGRGHAPSR
jgi:NTE family protein